MSAKKRIALVIGSGGIKCAAAVGLWRVLQEENIPVDHIVGCSGGSMYGTLIADNAKVGDMEAWSRVLWTSDIMQGYTENLKASKDGTLRFNERSGLVDDSALNKKLENVFGKLSFSDLQLPLKIVATDMLNGEKVILSEGNLFEAIRASVSMPPSTVMTEPCSIAL